MMVPKKLLKNRFGDLEIWRLGDLECDGKPGVPGAAAALGW